MRAGEMVIGSALFRDSHFGTTKTVHIPEDLEGVRLLVLHGGEDISPSIYGEMAVFANADNHPSWRDIREMALVKKAVEKEIPILGICRGAQLLCAMHGGKLYQHVDHHAGKPHEILVGDQMILTNSYHHQMMIPDPEAVVIGATTTALSKRKYREHPKYPVVDSGPEPEIVWFPKLKALGVQGHPEWMLETAPLNVITRDLLKKYCNVEVFT